MELAFGTFMLRPVMGCITEEESNEVRDMWVGERVLAEAEAARRTREVLFLIRESQSGELAGVCTVYPGPLGKTGRTYWHYRMFMRKKFRGVLGLPHFVLFTTRSYLEEHPPAGSEGICGVLIVAENPAFRRHYFREHFAKQKPPWILFGTNPRGRDIFYRDFKG
ncbi:MAG: hypothetical protein JHC52_07805 [Chthoniobacterales bacterium]|nr:hypothetical protein [Chthoniobacterales bacterium]